MIRRNSASLRVGQHIGHYTVVAVLANGVVVSSDPKGDGEVRHFVEQTTLAGVKKALSTRGLRDGVVNTVFADAVAAMAAAKTKHRNPRRKNGAEALPKVNRKRKNTKRLGGVEATYAGRIAGRCLAVSATGAEYMLDPEAVAHAGLREGAALIVRAVPGDFATFRRTVASPKKRKNGAATLTKFAADFAYSAGSDACRTRQYGDGYDEAAMNWLALNGPTDRAERVAWESAFIRGWKEAKAVARKAPTKRKNGVKSVADPVAARELELYIENESALVAAANSMGRMIMRNLAGMIARNTYDSTKAWKAWMPLADEGAKRYTREYGDRFGTVFNKATREMVANRLAEAFESEVRTGAINLATLLAPRANRRR